MIVYVSSVYSLPKYFLANVLRHYTSQGVDKFVFAAGNEEVWKEIKKVSDTYNIEIREESRPWYVTTDSDFKNEIRATLQENDWLVPADLDEFHFHPKFKSLKELSEAMAAEESVWARSSLVDRITKDGSIPAELLPDVPIEQQFPVSKMISKEVVKCCIAKVSICRPHVPIVAGHHSVPGNHKAFVPNGITHHYKWFGDFYAKERKKRDAYIIHQERWGEETDRLFDYLDRNGGKL